MIDFEHQIHLNDLVALLRLAIDIGPKLWRWLRDRRKPPGEKQAARSQ